VDVVKLLGMCKCKCGAVLSACVLCRIGYSMIDSAEKEGKITPGKVRQGTAPSAAIQGLWGGLQQCTYSLSVVEPCLWLCTWSAIHNAADTPLGSLSCHVPHHTVSA
jgi:hypothetical protein